MPDVFPGHFLGDLPDPAKILFSVNACFFYFCVVGFFGFFIFRITFIFLFGYCWLQHSVFCFSYFAAFSIAMGFTKSPAFSTVVGILTVNKLP